MRTFYVFIINTMTTVSLTDIQRNPKLISQTRDSVQIIDKRKNMVIGIYIPIRHKQDNKKKKALDAIAWKITFNKSPLEIQKELRNERL